MRLLAACIERGGGESYNGHSHCYKEGPLSPQGHTITASFKHPKVQSLPSSFLLSLLNISYNASPCATRRRVGPSIHRQHRPHPVNACKQRHWKCQIHHPSGCTQAARQEDSRSHRIGARLWQVCQTGCIRSRERQRCCCRRCGV